MFDGRKIRSTNNNARQESSSCEKNFSTCLSLSFHAFSLHPTLRNCHSRVCLCGERQKHGQTEWKQFSYEKNFLTLRSGCEKGKSSAPFVSHSENGQKSRIIIRWESSCVAECSVVSAAQQTLPFLLTGRWNGANPFFAYFWQINISRSPKRGWRKVIPSVYKALYFEYLMSCWGREWERASRWKLELRINPFDEFVKGSSQQHKKRTFQSEERDMSTTYKLRLNLSFHKTQS